MNVETLRQRAELLDRLRAFFRDRGFLEVETPLASHEVIPEQHIDLYQAESLGWLQASPEMHHKRLLCAGSGPIFEVTRSFRGHEKGQHHNPEFTIVEWYRPGDDMQAGMRLLEELIQDLLDSPSARRTSYQEAFLRAVGIDPWAAADEELRQAAEKAQGQAIPADADRDELLNTLLSLIVEPRLGQDTPEILYHYPPAQSALARITVDQKSNQVAERFELFYRGLELANGYYELADSHELRRRLEHANQQRAQAGKQRYPLPEKLLAVMQEPGLPPCTGVALGFDRLVMLATGAASIAEVRPFAGEA